MRTRGGDRSGSIGAWLLVGAIVVYGGMQFLQSASFGFDRVLVPGASLAGKIGAYFGSDEEAGKDLGRGDGGDLVEDLNVASEEEGSNAGVVVESVGGDTEGWTKSEEGITERQMEKVSEIPWLLTGFLESTLPVAETVALGAGEGENVKGNDQGSVFQEEKNGVNEDVLTNQQETSAGALSPESSAPMDLGVSEGAVSQSLEDSNIVSSPIITGAVLIYHTHSTESYEPYSAGNYHSVPETGTVREVGAHLTERLRAKGITVYHDQTLHDSPSYNSSYARSLDTLQRQLSARPEIQVVIDLHRDASATGKKYATTTVNGKTASSFNIVVGNQNENYKELLSFANTFLSTANELYPGLGGRIIEREYKFNGYMSDHWLLLEVGNNLNTIDEVNVTGDALADVVEAVMRSLAD